jgi:hypothetical protein
MSLLDVGTANRSTSAAAGPTRPRPGSPAAQLRASALRPAADAYCCFVDSARQQVHLSLSAFIFGMDTLCGRPMVSPGPMVRALAGEGWPPGAPPFCPACVAEMTQRGRRPY